MSDSRLISLEGLNWSYGEHEILRSITQEISEGCFTSILGPNGSGKTTMLRLMMRILDPDRNAVRLQGKDIHEYRRKDLARRIGSVPQQTDTSYPYSVYEMVMMGRYPHKRRLESLNWRDHEVVRSSLKTTDVCHLRRHGIHEISGGELQRVVIARALAQEPEILALDEPTSHLDPHHQLAILGLLRRLVTEQGISIICVLHDLNSAMRFSDQVMLLNHGRIVHAGTPEAALTADHIHEVYGINVKIQTLDDGTPYIIILGS